VEQHWITVVDRADEAYVVLAGRIDESGCADVEEALHGVVSKCPASLLVEVDVETLPAGVTHVLAIALQRAVEAGCDVRIGVLRPDLKELLDRDGRFPPVHLVEP